MQKRLCVSGMLAALLALTPAAAEAQIGLPIQLGISGGAAFPMGDFGRDDAFGTGWGFDASAVLEVAPAIGLYAAYDRYDFPLERDLFFGLAETTGNVVDQGFAGGLRLAMPGAGFGLSPWLRGGVVYNSLQFDYDEVDDDPESDDSLGFEVGGGLEFPLGFVVSVTPSVRYRSYTTDIGSSTDFDVSYIVGELGLTFRF